MSLDLVERLLTSLAVRAHAFAVCEIKTGHRLAFAPADAATIHYVLAGTGAIRCVGGDESYEPCCLIIVPAGTAHSLGEPDATSEVAASDAACGLLADGLVRFTAGDGSRDTLVVCATVTAIYGGALGLFDELSRPLIACSGENLPLATVFETLIREIASPSVGTQALVEALMKQALILVLRHHLVGLGAASPLFAPLRDARLASAVAAVLRQPADDWTVDVLASIAGMSRSSFAARFVRAFARTPMQFVHDVRLRIGADLLRSTDLPISTIAATAGFGSRTYFARSFGTAYAMTPHAFRSRGRLGEAQASSAPSATIGRLDEGERAAPKSAPKSAPKRKKSERS